MHLGRREITSVTSVTGREFTSVTGREPFLFCSVVVVRLFSAEWFVVYVANEELARAPGGVHVCEHHQQDYRC